MDGSPEHESTTGRLMAAVAVEIIPFGQEAHEVWGDSAPLVVPATEGCVSAVEAAWHRVPQPPAAGETRVTWVANHTLPAGGPVTIEVDINAPVEVVPDDPAPNDGGDDERAAAGRPCPPTRRLASAVERALRSACRGSAVRALSAAWGQIDGGGGVCGGCSWALPVGGVAVVTAIAVAAAAVRRGSRPGGIPLELRRKR